MLTKGAYSFKQGGQGSPDTFTSEQRPEVGERSHVIISGKRVPGRGKSKCKGSGAGGCLVCPRIGERASVARGDWSGIKDAGPMDHCQDLVFYSG